MNIKDFSWKCIRKGMWLTSKVIPVKKDKIVISSYYGRGYSDNARAIVDQLLKENCNYDIVWLLKDMSLAKTLPQGVRGVKLESIAGIYEQASARLWIDNCRKWGYVRKKPNQLYLQTWHGSLALKRIEADAGDALEPGYITSAQRDSKMTNLYLSNGNFFTDLVRRAFWYDGPILTCGSPRNDIIINGNSEVYDKVKKHFNLDTDTKICLYAPTFRKDFSLKAYDMDYMALKNSLEQRFGGKWVVMVRLHPNIFQKSKDLQLGDGQSVINGSYYDDMQDLLVTADMLITDYSSSMFDYFMCRKPVFIYASDIEDYAADRGFYFELDKLPFGLAQNNDEMQALVKNLDQNAYINTLNAWADTMGLIENGTASAAVCQWIKENM